MSKENVRLFLKKVQNDAALQEKIKSLIHGNLNAVLENIAKLGSENGYPFSPEDLQQFAQETAAAMKQNGELDDRQLEVVAGGGYVHFILFSMITLGFGCQATENHNCNQFIIDIKTPFTF